MTSERQGGLREEISSLLFVGTLFLWDDPVTALSLHLSFSSVSLLFELIEFRYDYK